MELLHEIAGNKKVLIFRQGLFQNRSWIIGHFCGSGERDFPTVELVAIYA